jgi:hypothetical protein
MNKQISILAAALLSIAMSHVHAATVNYGWEDGVGTVLSQFGAENIQYANTITLAHTGTRVLLIDDQDAITNVTPQGYVAWVTGLTDGDTVDASFWAYDNAASSAPSVRIWGHYTLGASDVDSYAGSAGGNNTYSGASAWSQLSHAWTFDSAGGTRDGLMVEVRFYDSASVPTGSALIDDLVVTSSAGSIVVPSAVPEAETWGMMLAGLGLVGFMARRRLA